MSHTSSIKSVDLDLDVGDSIIKFSSRWVLNQLMLYLNPYMECRCIHKKFGTILYRKNGNLLTSLSWALGSVTCDTSISQNVNDNFEFSINATPESHKALVLKQAGQIMNELIQNEIKRNECTSQNPIHLNINKYMNSINPLIVQFFNDISRTIREQHSSTC